MQAKTGAELEKALSLPHFAEMACDCISPAAWARLEGGAADEITLRWNLEAYRHIRLRPRVLVDVSQLDTRVTLFGQELPFPILLSPTGAQGFVHTDGDLGVARGAGAAEAILIISSSASMRVEEVVKAATATVWFQLYIQRDREFTRDLVQRAEAAGCRALCVSVDSPSHGARDREYRFKGQLPDRPLPNFQSKDYLDPTVTWKDIDWLQSFAKIPVLLKGIIDPDDADIAVQAGVSGIFVSNHGARNLDTVPATIDALPLVSARVQGRIPILVDGGIRRGTDIVKALALGATAVGIGRPYLHGLGVGGAAGVTRVLQILRREFELAMMLTGRPTIASIDRSVLWPT
ncbi:MAG: alpha-hydroxy-acid oxidizing protein [Bryobacterales bacterium]|nr:alpha-hydroxy-acid oxidizing protein [Bryobacterales bacterium]